MEKFNWWYGEKLMQDTINRHSRLGDRVKISENKQMTCKQKVHSEELQFLFQMNFTDKISWNYTSISAQQGSLAILGRV